MSSEGMATEELRVGVSEEALFFLAPRGTGVPLAREFGVPGNKGLPPALSE